MTKVVENSAAVRPMAARQTQAVMILGMHRSGTSACTRVLNLLGCALPKELIGAAEGNENGHWESQAVVNLNDQILESAGSRWNDWGPINNDWRGSPVRDDAVARASAVLADHAHLGPLFALKDPRLCRLADVWLDAMRQAQVKPLVLLMLRNPCEVAASLESRDLMAQDYGSLLWLRHVLDAEFLTRGQRRVVGTYGQLLDNWYSFAEQVKTGLGVSLPRNSPAIQAEIDEFLSRAHRHHQQPDEGVLSSFSTLPWLRRTWTIMLEWSEHGEAVQDHAELDEIRREFDRSYHTFARILMKGDNVGEFAAGSRLKNELSANLAETREALQGAEARLAASAEREAELKAQLQIRTTQAQELQAHLEMLEFGEPQVSPQLSELQEALEQAAQQTLAEATAAKAAELEELARLHQQAQGEMAEQLHRHQSAAEQARARLAESEASLDHLQAVKRALEEQIQRQQSALEDREHLQGQIAVAESTLVQRQEEIAQTRDELVGLRSAHDALIGERDSLSERLREADQWVFRLAADRKKLELEAARANKSLAKVKTESRSEIVSLKNKLGSFEVERDSMAGRVTKVESELAEVSSRLATLVEERDTLLGKLAQVTRDSDQRQSDIVALTQLLEEAERANKSLAKVKTESRSEVVSLKNKLESSEVERDTLLAKLAQVTRDSDQRQSDIVALTQLLEEAATKLAHAAKDADARLAAAERARVSMAADLTKTEHQASERLTEIVTLTRALEDSQLEIDTRQKNVDWLRDISRTIQSTPRWWSLLHKKEKRKRELRRLRNIGLFDSQAYLERYPDVLEAGMDPLDHYIIHGVNEGRSI